MDASRAQPRRWRTPGNTEPTWLQSATPGAPNAAAAGKIEFSTPGRLFSGTQTVTLSSLVPGMVIRYTTDGSTPAANSPAANGPITFSQSTVLRARGFFPNGSAGPVQTERYIRLANDLLTWDSDLPLVVIDSYGHVFDPNVPDLKPVFTAVIETNANGRTTLLDAADYAGRAGMKIRGASSLGFPKKQYKVELWDEADNEIDAKLLGMGKESDWVLYAPGRHDRNMIANNFVFDVVEQMGGLTLDARYVEVFVNNGPTLDLADYQGIYAGIRGYFRIRRE